MPPLNDTKIGKEFATRVAKKLLSGSELMYAHRDYCGTGLTCSNGEFIYCYVYDGYPSDTIQTFKTEESFIDWLAEQSDLSLAGLEHPNNFFWKNQRITRERLFDFLSTSPNLQP